MSAYVKQLNPILLSRVVTLAVLITVLAIAWVSWTLFYTYQVASAEIPRALKMQELHGRLVWFDLLSATSARLGVANGEPRWEESYRHFEKQQDEALKEVTTLGLADLPIAQAQSADNRTGAIEERAFKLSHEKHPEEAIALLEGDEYRKQEKIYGESMVEIVGVLRQSAIDTQNRMRRETRKSIMVAATAVLVLLLCWGCILVMMRRWQSTLVETNRELNEKSKQVEDANQQLNEKSKQAEESNRQLAEKSNQLEATNGQLSEQSKRLEEFSHELDKKVEERTGQLRESEIALLNMMDDTVRSQGNVQGALESLQREVAERKKIEAQFCQSQKMEAFGLLAGGIAHDFNNLMSVVMGYSDIWLMKLPPDAPIRGPLKAIRSAGERASDLTRQLLAFSRKTVLEPKILDLNTVVRETEKMLKRLIGEDIQLSSILNPAIPRIKIDPGQLGQVLMNLAVNARDAMPRGGSVTIETGTVDFNAAYVLSHPGAQLGRQVMLSVSDTGVGMPPEIVARIFEPFFTTKGVGKGTGLGLAVVHGVVTQSGGTIQVESTLDVGTTFKLYFPVTLDAVMASGKSEDILTFSGIETILLVEDEESLRDIAAESLRSFGYTVLTASTGSAALQCAHSTQGTIDLMISDVVMPGMSGRELADTLKAELPDLKVLFMSGYTDDSVLRSGVNHEKVAFLQKPFAPFDLLKKAREVLDKR